MFDRSIEKGSSFQILYQLMYFNFRVILAAVIANIIPNVGLADLVTEALFEALVEDSQHLFAYMEGLREEVFLAKRFIGNKLLACHLYDNA